MERMKKWISFYLLVDMWIGDDIGGVIDLEIKSGVVVVKELFVIWECGLLLYLVDDCLGEVLIGEIILLFFVIMFKCVVGEEGIVFLILFLLILYLVIEVDFE